MAAMTDATRACDGRVVTDRPTPFALGLAGKLGRRVEPHLAAEAGHRRGEVEVVDRRAVDQHRVAHRIHPGRDGPDDVGPAAHVDVVVGDDDELGVHELAQEAPDAEHDPLGVARVALPDADDRHPVAAALGRQVEVDDLGKLLLQDRHEHLVERDAQHGRLVGRLAGVGRVVDRIAAVRQALDLEHRKPVLLVVIAGVVAERSLERVQVAVDLLGRDVVLAAPDESGRRRRDVAFEDELGRRRRLQHHARVAHRALADLGAAAAQQAGELVLREAVGDRRDGAEHRRRVGAEGDGERERPAGTGRRELAEVERAAALRQPAHDHLAPADHLLPIDAEVLACAGASASLRPARDHQAPGDERADVVGPARLHRQGGEIDLVTLEPDLAAGRSRGCDRPHRPQASAPFVTGDRHRARPLGGSGSLRLASRTPMSRNSAHLGGAHRPGDPAGGPEQVGQHRNFVTRRIFEKKCRAAGAQDEVTDRCHLMPRRDWLCDPAQLAIVLQRREKLSQIDVFHIEKAIRTSASKG